MYSYLVETLTDVFSSDLRFDPKIRKDTAVRVSLSFYSIVKQPEYKRITDLTRQNLFVLTDVRLKKCPQVFETFNGPAPIRRRNRS